MKMVRRRKKEYQLKKDAGAHYLPAPGGLQRYTGGQKIMLYPEQAENLRYKLEPFEEEVVVDESETLALVIIERADGHYDVINEKTRQPVNDAPLTLAQARMVAGEGAEIENTELPDEEKDPPPPLSDKLSKQHRGGGRYMVIDEGSGEAISDNLFSREEADDLVYGRVSLDELRRAANK